jgi:upstream activation factor subunit UAF30
MSLIFSQFTMNKYVSAHVHPYKAVDLTINATVTKKRKTKAQKEGPNKKRKAGSGLSTPYQLSPELARVVGRNILPRPKVIKYVWSYIREHNLQNPEDKREIICDSNFKNLVSAPCLILMPKGTYAFFTNNPRLSLVHKKMGGKDKVTMFNMNKYITPHLLEKLDASYYTASDAEDQADENEEE